MARALAAALTCPFILLSCAPQSQQMVLVNRFDIDEALYIKKSGPSIIMGDAFVRQQGGGVVTCAGSLVRLTPDTKYSRERMGIIYRNSEKGYRLYIDRIIPVADASYSSYSRTTKCDAQGKFKFSDIFPGNYFVTTEVSWVISGLQQGGSLMQHLYADASKPTEIALSP